MLHIWKPELDIWLWLRQQTERRMIVSLYLSSHVWFLVMRLSNFQGVFESLFEMRWVGCVCCWMSCTLTWKAAGDTEESNATKGISYFWWKKRLCVAVWQEKLPFVVQLQYILSSRHIVSECDFGKPESTDVSEGKGEWTLVEIYWINTCIMNCLHRLISANCFMAQKWACPRHESQFWGVLSFLMDAKRERKATMTCVTMIQVSLHWKGLV